MSETMALPAGVVEIRRLVTPRVARAVPMAAVQGALALDLWGEADAVAPSPDPVDPEVGVWAHRFAQAVVEALGGVRPVTQLVRWTSTRVYTDLERRVRLLAQARSAGRAPTLIRPHVQSVHVSHPVEGVAEVAVHVRHGQRSRALAARLELRRGLWCCTALELG
jgi:hypothetical protein